jgi:hypothetical protein
MKLWAGMAASVAALAVVGCAQMRPSETPRETSGPQPAGASPILRGEEAPPVPAQVPPLPPDAGQTDFPVR